MLFEPGRMLAHYRLIEKIGEGGMGVVWRALDTQLDREVAIKILSEALSGEAERLARFEREAKLLGSLNHPHIATVHGFFEAGKVRFLAMELVAGEGLAEKLERGPVPLPEAVEIARQVAEALEAAHDNGVIHRDLKPANVRLTADERVKVLDFGLAKALTAEAYSGSPDPAQSPTITSLGTAAGVLLGTAAYMSPEQARGKAVDRRADIWTFGVVLFEMLTGEHPFQGETHSDTLAAVLRQEPDFELLPDGVSRRIRDLLRRCLERDPARRLQAIGEARIILEDEASGVPDSGESPEPGARAGVGSWRRSWLPWSVAAAAILVGIVLGTLDLGPPAERERVVSHLLPPQDWTYNTIDGPPVFSPDGCELAFLANNASGRTHLFLRALDEEQARLLEGTENAQAHFWSPDGHQLAFFADGKLKKINLRDGSPEVLADAQQPYGGSWSKDGTILFATRFPAGFHLLDERGGPVSSLRLARGEAWHVSGPQFLPDGRHFLFTVADLEGSEGGIHVGSLDDPDDSRLLLPVISRAAYVEPGWLLFWQEGSVRAVAFDAETRELGEETRRLAHGVGIAQYLAYGRFAAAGEDLLVYQPGSGRVGDTELVLLDRRGHKLSVVGPRAEYYAPRLSHDGLHVAVDITEFKGPESPYGDIWTFELRRGTRTRLTRSNVNASEPVWTPDNANVIFRMNPDLYIRDASAAAEQRLLFESDELKGPQDVSPDGRHLLFSRHVNERDLWVLNLESGDATPWIATDYAETGGRFSPDGRWVAYQSDESGLAEVYLQSFPETRERIVVSTGGGRSPAWRADAGELYYLSAAGEIVAVPVAWETGRPVPGEPQTLFRVRTRLYRPHGQFDALPDGQSFLVNRLVIEDGDEPLVLVQNWAAD